MNATGVGAVFTGGTQPFRLVAEGVPIFHKLPPTVCSALAAAGLLHATDASRVDPA